MIRALLRVIVTLRKLYLFSLSDLASTLCLQIKTKLSEFDYDIARRGHLLLLSICHTLYRAIWMQILKKIFISICKLMLRLFMPASYETRNLGISYRSVMVISFRWFSEYWSGSSGYFGHNSQHCAQ